MNPFVNPNKRAVELPAGCKDLNDVLSKIGKFRFGPALPQYKQGGLGELRTCMRHFYERVVNQQVLSIMLFQKSVLLIIRHDGESFKLELFLQSTDEFVKEAVTEIFGNIPPAGSVGYARLTMQVFRIPLPEYWEQAAQVLIDLLFRAYNISENDKYIYCFQDGRNWPKNY